MPSLSTAYLWSIAKCNEANIGYSQAYRNQQTVDGITYYDCSSFIWYALNAGNFDVRTAYRIATGEEYSGNAIWTAVEREWLEALNFQSFGISGQWKQGDILWREGHTEMVYQPLTVVGAGYTMGAHSSSLPLADQVSINTNPTYASTSTWTHLFRYIAPAPPTTGSKMPFYMLLRNRNLF